MIANRVRYFVAVAKAGGFGRAAIELGIAQAPLSQSIQRLERELGVLLFDRHPKGVTLTDAGRAYLPDAEVALAASERARRLALAQATATRSVRLGVITPALWGALPSLLAAARSANVRVDVVKGTTDELLNGLATGRLDLSFVAPPVAATDRLTVIDVENEPLMAAFPRNDKGASQSHADLARMAEALVLFPRDYRPRLHDALIALFVDNGLRPNIVLESTPMMTALALVAAGIGSSIISPSLAAAVSVEGVVYRPFAPGLAVPSWPVALAYIEPAERTLTARLLAQWRPAALLASP